VCLLLRPSRLLAAKDDRDQFAKAIETSRREATLCTAPFTVAVNAQQQHCNDVDDDDDDDDDDCDTAQVRIFCYIGRIVSCPSVRPSRTGA